MSDGGKKSAWEIRPGHRAEANGAEGTKHEGLKRESFWSDKKLGRGNQLLGRYAQDGMTLEVNLGNKTKLGAEKRPLDSPTRTVRGGQIGVVPSGPRSGVRVRGLRKARKSFPTL